MSKLSFPDVTEKLSLSVLRAIGSEKILPLAKRAFSGSDELLRVSMPDPRSYDCALDFACDYLSTSLLSKFDSFDLGVDKKAVALAKWRDSEERCALVNRLGRLWSPIRSSVIDYERVIRRASSKISWVLGPLDLNEVSDNFGFSGGATTRCSRRRGHPFHKYQGKPEVTRRLALFGLCAIWHDEIWRAEMLSVDSDPVNWVTLTDEARLTTVAKNSKVDRVICIEPCLNMYVQRGFGAVIRRRLRSVGINLRDQSRNQELARKGSLDSSLATIDLSSASDSISMRVVRELLPPDWYEALDRARTHEVDIDGETLLLQKFSSMGNGFTFELESLIFWAIAQSVADELEVTSRDISVYGDDIIVPTDVAGPLIDMLNYIGFETNVDKTFIDGPFRESCGKHYFLGSDVTPFYIKKPIVHLADLYWLANSFRHWCEHVGYHDGWQTYRYLVKQVPKRHRHVIPSSLGLRQGLHGAWHESPPTWLPERQTFSLKLLIEKGKSHRLNGRPASMAWYSQKRGTTILVTEGTLSIESHKRVHRFSEHLLDGWVETYVFTSLVGLTA